MRRAATMPALPRDYTQRRAALFPPHLCRDICALRAACGARAPGGVCGHSVLLTFNQKPDPNPVQHCEMAPYHTGGGFYPI